MKITERWLREWLTSEHPAQALADALTRGGIEVASLETLAGDWSQVVTGRILSVAPHPNADRLRLCAVDVGDKTPLEIVCGAANAAAGLVVPVALVGARLPGGMEIREASVRGVRSAGMLCSASELGLEESSAGLLVLDAGITVGMALATVLELPDRVFELEITPNRGDCLSVAGIARELAFLTGDAGGRRAARVVTAREDTPVSVTVDSARACPHYLGRSIRGINPDAQTPLWLRERLRRAGLRSHHPVVDITNYVMLERGQPLHAFTLSALKGQIVVRQARHDEQLVLLDGKTLDLDPDMLLITNGAEPLALAGIMGGLGSAVTAETTDLFLESAHFRPEAIAATVRRLGWTSDAAQRFERGVDPAAARAALDDATALILEICGGKPGHTLVQDDPDDRPAPRRVTLRASRLARVLGTELPSAEVATLLARIDPGMTADSTGWTVTLPSYRFDLEGEWDLIEEVARGLGYERIPEHLPSMVLAAPEAPTGRGEGRVRTLLADRGYHEAITYSFIASHEDAAFAQGPNALVLSNPLAAQWSHLRRSLIPGLLTAVAYNQNRQQDRIRLFEIGAAYEGKPGEMREPSTLGLVATGSASPRAWSLPSRPLDFFDVKSDLEAVLGVAGSKHWHLEAADCPGLQPGQSARVWMGDKPIGMIGAVHPDALKSWSISDKVFCINIYLDNVLHVEPAIFQEIARFPSIRRDLALTVSDSVPVGTLLDAISGLAGELLVNLEVFDEYRGEHVDSGRKSVAFTLTFQDPSRTLTEERVEELMTRVVTGLSTQYGGRLRS